MTMQAVPTGSNGTSAQFTPVGDIPQLVSDLREVFDSGRTRPVEWRLRQLDGLRKMLIERESDIAGALAQDLGKPGLEAYIAEIGHARAELDYIAKRLKKWAKPQKVGSPIVVQPGKSYRYSDPLGLVLIIAPWNYPFSLAIDPLVGALAAGNCVVVKPSEVAEATSTLIAKLLPEYIDAEATKVVEGGVKETTALLDEKWDHIFYTGNGTVGRIVMTAAAKNLTPVTLELGGKSPCIVDKDIDIDVAIKRIAWGKWYNAGQTCVAPDYLLVHEDAYDYVVNKLKYVIREFWGDDPKKSKDYGRVINKRHHQRLCKLLDSGEVVTGGQTDEDECYIAPTVLKNVSPDSPVMQEEIFGPILPVLKVKNINEAISFVNARDKPLALYVFSNNEEVAERILNRTSSGGATVNHAWLHLGNPELPFGGVGESGMGGYHGKASFDTFTHKKSVLKKGFKVDPPLMYPPYTDSKKKWIRRLA